MKTVVATEKFNDNGFLYERIVETTETFIEPPQITFAYPNQTGFVTYTTPVGQNS